MSLLRCCGLQSGKYRYLKVCGGEAGWLEPDYSALVGYELDEATCDGVDNDCNGVIDDGLSAPNADNQQGVCAGALKVCSGASGWTEPDYAMMANFQASEAWCDELDNDCDGEVDEPFKAGGSVSFTDADGSGGLFKNDGCGVGDCSGGLVAQRPACP